MDERLKKPYDPQATEARIYSLWEKSGFFNPDNLPHAEKEPFTIIMPPTNANGSLHAGHALVMTIEDIMIRYKRMRGYKTLWLPGTDHAGFETQVVYEKHLEKEGRSRMKMSPQELYDEIYSFTTKNKEVIISQIKSMGASCDWSRERFTLDKEIIKTVYDTFKRLSDDNLLYRGKRIVNWCTKHQTSLSELEAISEERHDPLYYITYGPFTVATVRPETKFGDTALAVNPEDSRYKNYIGKEVEVDHLIGKVKLLVIADNFVDPEFGTGVVKVTPSHDPNDFEMALRHNLPAKEVIDKFGKLNESTGLYAGLKIEEARKKVVDDLKEEGLLERVDEQYKHSIKKCYKCSRTLEPRVMPQWFVKMKPLAEKALSAVERGDITFIPDHYKKVSLHWLSNIEDWNISRQIVWGIPIPAKICDICAEGFVDLADEITACPSCKGSVRKDTDTFDTWFSSGQWPYAALGYPNHKDFKNFYPTDVMETAGEIIFFWVARMIMLGLYRTDVAPFLTVYLHGLVLDAKGQKMSKSKGNVINPLTLTEKYGTDALRIGLVVGNTPGTSLALSEDRIRGYKHFANKMWNASRFVIENTEGASDDAFLLNTKDAEILDAFSAHILDVTKDMDEYRFYMAAEKLYHYFWHTFADTILEESKDIFKNGTEEKKKSRQALLLSLLRKQIALLHPFMPFVTEELWSLLSPNEEMLMVSAWPE